MKVGGISGLRVGLRGDVRNGLGKHERAFGSVVVIVVIDGAEVDTRASFQGCEEGGGHAGTEPIGGAIQLLTGYEPTIVGHSQYGEVSRFSIGL